MFEDEKTLLDETLEAGSEVEEVVHEEVPQPAPDPGQNQNIRMLREAKEKVQRERDELQRKLLAYEQQQFNQQKAAAGEDTDEDDTPAPDDLVEWKVVDRKIKKLEQKITQQYRQSEDSNAEMRLKAQYPDWNQIVNKDNVELVSEIEPELIESIKANPNTYSKGLAAYKAIKRILGVQNHTVEKDRVVKNAAKPRTSSAASKSDSPLGNASAFSQALSEDQRKALWEEMQIASGRKW